MTHDFVEDNDYLVYAGGRILLIKNIKPGVRLFSVTDNGSLFEIIFKGVITEEEEFKIYGDAVSKNGTVFEEPIPIILSMSQMDLTVFQDKSLADDLLNSIKEKEMAKDKKMDDKKMDRK